MKRISIYLSFTILLLGFSFSKSLEWLTDYDTAIENSISEDKNILLVFSGSDWCKPCIRLEQQVFEKETFKNFADKKLILLRADFPRKRKNKLSKSQTQHNEGLAEKYNTSGQFPLVLILDKNGKVLKTLNSTLESPEAFIKQF